MAVSDSLSRVRIKAMLIGDRRVGDLDIDVDVQGGTATLKGEVESLEQKKIAEQLAREIEGIMEVDNELKVKIKREKKEVSAVPPHWLLPTEEAGINIAAMTENIERRIAEDGRITSKNINVVVDNGVARLTGKVDSLEESYLVQEAAESVAGIKEVQNELEIDEGHKGHTCNCGRM